jgi:hypothetical protein
LNDALGLFLSQNLDVLMAKYGIEYRKGQEVTARLFTFTDVINEMRRKTERMTAAQLPLVPEKASKGLSFIQNPLTFDPSKLPATSLAEIGTWWSGMGLEDRRQFAAYYGLWCALFRARK